MPVRGRYLPEYRAHVRRHVASLPLLRTQGYYFIYLPDVVRVSGRAAAGPAGPDEANGVALAAPTGGGIGPNLACSQASCSAENGVASPSIALRSLQSGGNQFITVGTWTSLPLYTGKNF